MAEERTLHEPGLGEGGRKIAGVRFLAHRTSFHQALGRGSLTLESRNVFNSEDTLAHPLLVFRVGSTAVPCSHYVSSQGFEKYSLGSFIKYLVSRNLASQEDFITR
jgi:hypothetical protein